MKLTDSQLQAINTESRRVAVVACPGSGKTTVLSKRILNLIKKGVSPKSILALTFTNKAAEELRDRFGNGLKSRKVLASTFHGFALRILRDFGPNVGIPSRFTIYDEQDRADIMQDICKETGRKCSKKALDKEYRNFRVKGIFSDMEIAPVIEEYLRRLRSQVAMDFDTMMVEASTVLAVFPAAAQFYHDLYEHILVDEAQDTDFLQHQLISSINPQNLYHVADIDQCIYEWRNAVPAILLGEIRDPGFEVIRLEETHRCTGEVAVIANRVINNNINRFEKEIKAYRSGEPVSFISFPDRRIEGEWIWKYAQNLIAGDSKVPPEEIFVLARTNRQVRYLSYIYHNTSSRAFKIDDISKYSEMWNSSSVRTMVNSIKLVANNKNQYVAENSVFASKADTPGLISKALFNETSLLAEMQLVDNWLDEFILKTMTSDDVFTIANSLAHYYCSRLQAKGLTSQAREVWDFVNYLFDWRATRESTSVDSFLDWYAARTLQDNLELDDSSVKLMTIHAAKGLEAKYVILAGVNKDVFPSRRSEIEEERRLFYVAVTRASEKLSVCYEEDNPSVFIEEATQSKPQRRSSP